MKKIISLTLVLALCLSLCACGGTTDTPAEETIPLKDTVIGTWVYRFEITADDGYFENRDDVGDECSITLKLYKGGTGDFIRRNDTKDYDKQTLSLTWEIQDDVIRITRPALNITEAYTYDADANTLENVDGSELFNKEK